MLLTRSKGRCDSGCTTRSHPYEVPAQGRELNAQQRGGGQKFSEPVCHRIEDEDSPRVSRFPSFAQKVVDSVGISSLRGDGGRGSRVPGPHRPPAGMLPNEKGEGEGGRVLVGGHHRRGMLGPGCRTPSQYNEYHQSRSSPGRERNQPFEAPFAAQRSDGLSVRGWWFSGVYVGGGRAELVTF